MRRESKSVISILKMICSYEPFYLPISILKILIQSFTVWFMVWFPKLIIEMLTSEDSVYTPILQKTLWFVSIVIVIGLINLLISSKENQITEHFVQKMRKEIGVVSMDQPLWVIESGSYREKLNMANNILNILKGVGLLESIIEGVITSTGLAILLIRYDVRICILIFIVIGVKVTFVKYTVQYSKKRRYLYSKNDKVGNYLTNTAYMNAGAAKEIRINNISSWFMQKVRAYRNEMLMYQYKDFRVYALFDILATLLMAGQTIVVLLSLTKRVTMGMLSIADFTLYFSAIVTISSTLAGIITKSGEYSQYKMGFGDFSGLYQTTNKNTNSRKDTIAFRDICFEHVSFKYPNTERYVLNDINFKINKGEKLSIVGLNGAGKSTLVKLLCKFYRPSSGRIVMNGIDIWEIDDSIYYEMLSAVFQDYVNFAFTLKENIQLNNMKEPPEVVAKKVGFATSFENFPKGYDTIVSRMFDDEGIELSGGEQQKLAILRACCKNAPIAILDEPTKALDAKTEAEMYDGFFKLMKDKTTIFISHRLASSVVADKILVLDNGCINDYGTHAVLMKKGGLYSEMYRKQSEVYCE